MIINDDFGGRRRVFDAQMFRVITYETGFLDTETEKRLQAFNVLTNGFMLLIREDKEYTKDLIFRVYDKISLLVCDGERAIYSLNKLIEETKEELNKEMELAKANEME